MTHLPRKSSAAILAARADDAVFQHQYRTLIRCSPYAWLLDGPAWWTAKEVAAGLGVSPATIRRACERKDLRGALNHGHRVGWRIPFDGLIYWLYALQEQNHAPGHAEAPPT